MGVKNFRIKNSHEVLLKFRTNEVPRDKTVAKIEDKISEDQRITWMLSPFYFQRFRKHHPQDFKGKVA